jgi:uncharacterized protein YbaP (TraB family)
MTRHAIRLPLALLFVVATCLQVAAAPANFVWKVTSPAGTSIYLAGSIHLLSADFYPLDPAFEQAFDDSNTLVEELDMTEMLSPASQMTMLSRGMLPAGTTLDSVISADTLKLVSGAIEGLGLPVGPLRQFKPWKLAVTLQGEQWQQLGFDPNLGLDKYFYDKAMLLRKPIQGLETLDFQLSRFDGMSPELQDRMLAETVRELESTKANLTTLSEAWKTGNVAEIERLVVKDIETQPEMYERLIVERNRNWMPKIEALFAASRPSFVIVGAAHLVGSQGLLQLLASKGYTLTQL